MQHIEILCKVTKNFKKLCLFYKLRFKMTNLYVKNTVSKFLVAYISWTQKFPMR